MSTQHSVSEDEHGSAENGPPDRWIVWRQDDNGNRFEVVRKDSHADADEIRAALEARGHKQLYWVGRAPR